MEVSSYFLVELSENAGINEGCFCFVSYRIAVRTAGDWLNRLAVAAVK